MKCQQKPAYRYTWPGKDEAFTCSEHAGQLRAVANAIGINLQLIILSDNEQKDAECLQKVKAV